MERKNIYIVILTITTIIAACFAIYFYINPTVVSVDVKEENDIVTENEVNTSSTSNSVSNDKENNATQPEVKVEDVKIRPEINTDRCLNSEENKVYTAYRRDSDSNLGITCTIEKNNTVNVSFSDLESLSSNYGVKKPSNLSDGGYYTYAIIDNFLGKKVVDVYIKGMGQAVGNEVLYFLMEDGTVQYMPVRKAIQNSDFKSYGNIEELSNIVEIVDGSAGMVNGPGYLTPFAITKDGECYELSAIVNKLLY
jgi:hypothetical protein